MTKPSASVSTTAWQSRVHAHGGRRCHGGKTNEIDVVQTVPGNTWIDGGEENVAVAKTIHYTADEVKAGDYIYSGRSTSDGGLRKRYPNGKAQVIADPKPQSVAGKTVAGVVFCIPKDTDPTGRLTPARLTDDKIMMKDFPNAEIWNYIVNPSLVAAGGPTPIYTTSYWSSTEAYYSPNNAYAIHFPDATLESNDKYL